MLALACEQAQAQALADTLSEEMWGRREDFMPVLLTPTEAVQAAVEWSAAAGNAQPSSLHGPVVLADMSVSICCCSPHVVRTVRADLLQLTCSQDNPGGGGASDSVAILAEFLRRSFYRGVAVGAIVDTEVVGLATSAASPQRRSPPIQIVVHLLDALQSGFIRSEAQCAVFGLWNYVSSLICRGRSDLEPW